MLHCVKSVQIRSYFGSVFSCIRTEYGPEITPYLNTFHTMLIKDSVTIRGRLQISLLISRNLSKLTFIPPRNDQKTVDFLMISGEIKVD